MAGIGGVAPTPYQPKMLYAPQGPSLLELYILNMRICIYTYICIAHRV